MDASFALGSVHVPSRAANERFVRFDGPRHFINAAVVHGVADTLKHEPSGFLGQVKCACDFIARNAVLAVAQHPHSSEPLVESNGRILKYGSDFDRELLTAREASPHQAGLEKRQALAFATWAFWTVRPLNFGNRFNANNGSEK